MSESYAEGGDMNLFTQWANELCKNNPEFADSIIQGIVSAEFADVQMLDKTE